MSTSTIAKKIMAIKLKTGADIVLFKLNDHYRAFGMDALKMAQRLCLPVSRSKYEVDGDWKMVNVSLSSFNEEFKDPFIWELMTMWSMKVAIVGDMTGRTILPEECLLSDVRTMTPGNNYIDLKMPKGILI